MENAIKNSNLDKKNVSNSEKKPTLFCQLLREVKEWCETTSIHGFSRLVSSENWIKRMIWFLFIIFFAYYSIQSKYYFNDSLFLT